LIGWRQADGTPAAAEGIEASTCRYLDSDLIMSYLSGGKISDIQRTKSFSLPQTMLDSPHPNREFKKTLKSWERIQ
jgi:hypothetical protein